MERQPMVRENVCKVVQHQFLKGPVEGCDGVKYGVITFAHREIHWEDLLKQVLKERDKLDFEYIFLYLINNHEIEQSLTKRRRAEKRCGCYV